MQPKEPTPRRAGRVLVIDPAGRVLLLQGFDPANPSSLHWITIGGGTDHREGTAEAALRETVGRVRHQRHRGRTDRPGMAAHHRVQFRRHTLPAGRGLLRPAPRRGASHPGPSRSHRARNHHRLPLVEPRGTGCYDGGVLPGRAARTAAAGRRRQLTRLRAPDMRRSAGRSPSSAAQTGTEEDQGDQEHDDANDQQIKQALDCDAEDTQDYGRDNEQQEDDHRKAFPF